MAECGCSSVVQLRCRVYATLLQPHSANVAKSRLWVGTCSDCVCSLMVYVEQGAISISNHLARCMQARLGISQQDGRVWVQ
jgi:hypothetical protein